MARGTHPLVPSRPSGSIGANRFDPLTADVGVLYFGSDLETCFGETLARFRPSLPLLSLVEDEWRDLGFMDVGSVAADWRQRRSAVHVRLPSDALFLDVESVLTHQFLREELALGLSALGLDDLDVAAVRGPDRRVTQLIADWAYRADDGGEPLYAGIRYESRIKSGWECWALFDDEDLEVEILETLPVTTDMLSFKTVATLYGLQVF
ncbi:MAG TPA: RES family NAD+ phosphorylase [Chloroflexota bacterium]|nr:RES family NAD+ phosphorylase [Chloroflexota bacterium]